LLVWLVSPILNPRPTNHPTPAHATHPQLEVALCYAARGRDLSPYLQRLTQLQTLRVGSINASRSGWGDDPWDKVSAGCSGLGDAARLRSFRLAARGPPRWAGMSVNAAHGAAGGVDDGGLDELAQELALCESVDLGIEIPFGSGPEGVPPPPPEWPSLALGRMLRAAPALAGTLVSLWLMLRVDGEAALGVAAPLLAQPLPRLRELFFYCSRHGAVQAGDVAALAQLRAPHLCQLSLPREVLGGHEAAVAAATAVCMALPRPPRKGPWRGGDGFLHIHAHMLTVQEAGTLAAALEAAGRGWVKVR
jgi:hypothetical protein